MGNLHEWQKELNQKQFSDIEAIQETYNWIESKEKVWNIQGLMATRLLLKLAMKNNPMVHETMLEPIRAALQVINIMQKVYANSSGLFDLELVQHKVEDLLLYVVA